MTKLINNTLDQVYLRLTPGEPGILVEPGEAIDVDAEAAADLIAGGTFRAHTDKPPTAAELNKLIDDHGFDIDKKLKVGPKRDAVAAALASLEIQDPTPDTSDQEGPTS